MQHEIAIVGAGMAGLVCARELQAAGRDVVVIDKSRGLGGRLATRRLGETHADHGVCYLKPKVDRFRALIDDLVRQGVVAVWSDRLHQLSAAGLVLDPQPQPRYAAPKGATAIAKALAKGLTLELNRQIQSIQPIEGGWQLTSQDPEFTLTAKIVILGIPAPQALPLVRSIANPEFVESIQVIEFAPCLCAIAVYPELGDLGGLRGVTCLDDELLGWIGFDSTKQIDPKQTTMIIQSNATFAADEFDSEDLNRVAQRMCDRAAAVLTMPWISEPELLQLHRWKYAFAINPIESQFLSATTDSPLYCIGDWCGGDRVESAFLSGLAMTEHVTYSHSESKITEWAS
jgi:renalase